jgi:hypothetical protein
LTDDLPSGCRDLITQFILRPVSLLLDERFQERLVRRI